MEIIKNYSNYDLPSGWQARLYLPQKRTISLIRDIYGLLDYVSGDQRALHSKMISLPHTLYVRIEIPQNVVGLAVFCTQEDNPTRVLSFPVSNVRETGIACLDMDGHYCFRGLDLPELIDLFWGKVFFQKSLDWMDIQSPGDVYKRMKYHRYPMNLVDILARAYEDLKNMVLIYPPK